MDNENQEEVINTENQEQPVEDTLEVNHRSGYINDPEEFARVTGKPIEDFRSEEDFDKFGELKEEIKSLREEVKTWKHTATTTLNSYTSIDQRAYERAYRDLQQKIQDAAIMGEDTSDYLNELNSLNQQNQQKQIAAQAEINNRLEQEFISRNKDWYNESNLDLVHKAQALFSDYMTRDKTANPQEVLQAVEKNMRAFYVQPSDTKQKSLSASQPNISRSTSNVNQSAHQSKGVKLTPTQQKAYENLKQLYAQTGDPTLANYTPEQYLNSLERFGD